MEEYELKSKKKDKVSLSVVLKNVLIRSTEKWRDFYIFRLVFQKTVIYEFLGKNSEEIGFWKLQEGIFYWHNKILGFFHAGLHLQAKREYILNVFVKDETVYIIQNNTITRFQYKSKHKTIKGMYKLPISTELTITNLFDHFTPSSLKQSFLYSKVNNIQLLIAFTKIGVIKSDQIIQVFSVSSPIISITDKVLETINKEYLIEKKPEKTCNQPVEFVPQKKTLLALNQFNHIDEVIDLFFFKTVSMNLEKKLTNDWHLDPLDRSFLASDKFYQEQLYDYLEKYLDLTVQGLFLTNPDKLLMLQEALREQEGRIYRDGHLQPNKTIASLITSSLPMLSSYDTVLQSNIRSLFLKSLKKN